MLALLIAGGLVYLALGDWREALILLVFANLSIAITVVQETRTERVLDALRDLTSPRALVIRDGERKRIPGREVARGDLLVLSEGDRVPADAAVVECEDLQVDELLLTGESVPVRKVARANADAGRGGRPGGEDLPNVFSGSLIARRSAFFHRRGSARPQWIGKANQAQRNRTQIGAANPAVRRRRKRLGQRREPAVLRRPFSGRNVAIRRVEFRQFGRALRWLPGRLSSRRWALSRPTQVSRLA